MSFQRNKDMQILRNQSDALKFSYDFFFHTIHSHVQFF
jgi:hypothetical protein